MFGNNFGEGMFGEKFEEEFERFVKGTMRNINATIEVTTEMGVITHLKIEGHPVAVESTLLTAIENEAKLKHISTMDYLKKLIEVVQLKDAIIRKDSDAFAEGLQDIINRVAGDKHE